MKRLSLLLIIVSVSTFFSCGREKAGSYVILSGRIEYPNSDSLSISNIERKTIKTIYLKDDNTFRDTIDVTEGYYYLRDGKEYANIYLKPKFDLKLSLNTKEFDESLRYEGAGSNENNYLAEKMLLQEQHQIVDWTLYGKFDEESFLKLMDSLYDVKKNLLKKHEKDLDEDFTFIEFKSLEFERSILLSVFEEMRQYSTKDYDFKVSDHYPDPYDAIDLSNERLLISPNYLRFVRRYLNIKSAEKTSDEDSYEIEYLKILNEEAENKKIKEKLAYLFGKRRLTYTKRLDSLYNEIEPLLINKKYRDEIAEQYETLKKVQKGSVSPIFELNDIDGKLVSLKDLKGKLVYIDVWATWCRPCVAEIPSLKKMEEYFKGKEIYFVSICTSSKKEDWEKMVSEKELGGIQLFAPDDNITFFEDYLVRGIPRFILLDKEGKIIDSNAKRPSNPEIKEEIEKYL